MYTIDPDIHVTTLMNPSPVVPNVRAGWHPVRASPKVLIFQSFGITSRYASPTSLHCPTPPLTVPHL